MQMAPIVVPRINSQPLVAAQVIGLVVQIHAPRGRARVEARGAPPPRARGEGILLVFYLTESRCVGAYS